VVVEQEHTSDGHFVIINGRRRGRPPDPGIPSEQAARLRSLLMAARRDVGAALRSEDAEAERDARARVHLAKVALGERGTPWWEQTASQRRQRWQDGLAALDDRDA
jgi:hypothetical protein